MDRRTCCFTGHRSIPAERRCGLTEQLKQTVRRLVTERGVRCFAVGGALGFDALAADVLFELREGEFPDLRVILIYPFDGFTDRWTPEERAAYERRLPRYDRIIRASETPSREAYLLRNRMLVDGADCCVAYCTRTTGGTAYTVRYAERQGVEVLRLP